MRQLTARLIWPILPALVLEAVSTGDSWAGELWVANGKSANVSVIDTASLEVIATIPADKGPHNVTISPDGKLALVANVGANNVTFIDAVGKKVLTNVAAGGPRTHHVSVSPDGRTAVASNMGGDTVTLIDIRLAKNIGSITTDRGALMSVYSPDGEYLYVVNAKAGTVSVVEEHFREIIGYEGICANKRLAACLG